MHHAEMCSYIDYILIVYSICKSRLRDANMKMVASGRPNANQKDKQHISMFD